MRLTMYVSTFIVYKSANYSVPDGSETLLKHRHESVHNGGNKKSPFVLNHFRQKKYNTNGDYEVRDFSENH